MSIESHAAVWLPLDVAMRLPTALALAAGLLLFLGAATRQVTLLMLAALLGFSVVDPRLTDSIYLLMVLALLSTFGGGTLAADALAIRWYKQRQALRTKDPQGWPRVVIVGAGFGGLTCARASRARASR